MSPNACYARFLSILTVLLVALGAVMPAAMAQNPPAWEDALPAASPSQRGNFAMAWDGVAKRVVLFGGEAPGANGETWEWDGETWSQFFPDPSPAPRSSHAMAFDKNTERTVLFGGSDANSAALNDTWTWDGTTWTKMSGGATTPTSRFGHSMAWNPATTSVILFGGRETAGSKTDSTFRWDGTAWQDLGMVFPAGAPMPPARDFGTMATRGDGVYLFGGNDSNEAKLNDLWKFDRMGWHPVELAAGAPQPSPRANTAMATDPGRGRTVLFGGFVGGQTTSTFLGDTWEFDGTQWTMFGAGTSAVQPPARFSHAMAFAGQGEVLLFGGNGAEGSLGDTWLFGAQSMDSTTGTTGTTDTTTPTGSPDLVGDPSALSGQVDATGQVFVTAVIDNQGGPLGAADVFGALFLLQPEQATQTGPIQLGRITDITFPSGADHVFVEKSFFPAQAIPQGSYRLQMFIDSDPQAPNGPGQIAEADETNNQVVSNQVFTVGDQGGVTQGIDLAADGLGAPPLVPPGGFLKLNATIANRGSEPSPPSTAAFWLSADTIASPETDIKLGSTPVPPIDPAIQQFQPITVEFQLDAGIPQGRYFVWMSVDPMKNVSDVNRGNNRKFARKADGTFQVTEIADPTSDEPDLVVPFVRFRIPGTNTNAGAADVFPGGPLGVDVIVANQSQRDITGFIEIDISLVPTTAGKVAGQAGPIGLGRFSLSSGLSAGSTATATGTFTIPSAVAPGSYNVLAKVDPNDAIFEGNEENNVGLSSSPLNVLDPSGSTAFFDIVLEDLRAPREALVSGQTIPVTVTLRIVTSGTEPIFNVPVGFAIRVPATMEGFHQAGTVLFPSVIPNERTTLTVDLTIPAALPPKPEGPLPPPPTFDAALNRFVDPSSGEPVFDDPQFGIPMQPNWFLVAHADPFTEFGEPKENNRFRRRIFVKPPITENTPNIVARSASASPAATVGGPIHVSATISNSTSATVHQTFSVAFLLTETDTFDPFAFGDPAMDGTMSGTAGQESSEIVLDHFFLGERRITGIGPSATVSASGRFQVPFAVRPGPYFVLATADFRQNVFETDESDNRVFTTESRPIFPAPTGTVGAGLPDLVTRDVEAPEQAAAGGPIQVGARVQNLGGTGTGTGFPVAFFIEPATFDGDGSFGDGSFGDGSFGGGSFGDGSFGDGSFGDGSFGDGSFGGGFTKVAGQTSGTGDGSTFFDGGTADQEIFLGETATPALRAGEGRFVGGEFPIPFFTQPGTYHVFAVADDPNIIEEANEDNNEAEALLPLHVGDASTGGNLADLVIRNVTSLRDVASQGGELEVTATVRNIGQRDAGFFEVGFFLIPANRISEENPPRFFIGAVPIGGVPIGGESPVRTRVRIPDFFETGFYVLSARVDDTQQVPESNEDNNSGSAFSTLEVKAPTGGFGFDLINVRIEGPASASITQTFTATGVIDYAGGTQKLDIPVTFIGRRQFEFDPFATDPNDGFISTGDGSGGFFKMLAQVVGTGDTGGFDNQEFAEEFIFGHTVVKGVDPSTTRTFTATLRVPFVPLNQDSTGHVTATTYEIGFVIDREGRFEQPKHNDGSAHPFPLSVEPKEGATRPVDILPDLEALGGRKRVSEASGNTAGPAELVPGDQLEMLGFIRNRGQAVTDPFLVEFFIERPLDERIFEGGDDPFHQDDPFIDDPLLDNPIKVGEQTAGDPGNFQSAETFHLGQVIFSAGLTQSETATVAATFPTPPFLAPGPYVLGIAVDPFDEIPEAREDNNRKLGQGLEVRELEDIFAEVEALSVTAGPVATIGANLDVTGEFVARADGPTIPRLGFSFNLSQDGQIGFDDIELGHDVLFDVPGDGTPQSVDRSFIVPFFLRPGEYSVGFIVDAGNAIFEPDEENNAIVSDTRTTLTAPTDASGAPDLAAVSVRGPEGVRAGGKALVTGIIKNLSTEVSVEQFINVAVFLSPDQFGERESAIFLSRFFVDRLSAGESRIFEDRVPIPFVQPGTYFLGMVADPDDFIFEANEKNNKTISSAQLRVTTPEFLLGLPDLALKTAQGPTVATSAGAPINVAVTVGAAGDSTEQFNFSVGVRLARRPDFDPRFPGPDVIRLRRFEGLQLRGGQSELFSSSINLPRDLQPGQYFIGFAVDPDDVIAEQDENNNSVVLQSLPFEVTPPDASLVNDEGNLRDDHPDFPDPNNLRVQDRISVNQGGTDGFIQAPATKDGQEDVDVFWFEVPDSVFDGVPAGDPAGFLTVKVNQFGLNGSIVDVFLPPPAGTPEGSFKDRAAGQQGPDSEFFNDPGFIGATGPQEDIVTDFGSGTDGAAFLANLPVFRPGLYFVAVRGRPDNFLEAFDTSDFGTISTGDYEVEVRFRSDRDRVIDLLPVDISVEPSRPTSETTVAITFSVGNVGTTTATTVNVILELQPREDFTNLAGTSLTSGTLGNTIQSSAKQVLATGTIDRLEPGRFIDAPVTVAGPFPEGKYDIVVKVDPRNRISEINEGNNSVGQPLRVGPPDESELEDDLVALDMSIDPILATTTTTLTLKAAIGNFGANPAENITVTIKRDVTSASPGRTVTSFDLAVVPADDVLPLKPVRFGPLGPGRHNVVLIVDDGNRFPEFDERNNRLRREFFVDQGAVTGGFDLRVVGVTISPKRPTSSDEILLSGTAINQGDTSTPGMAPATLTVVSVDTGDVATSIQFDIEKLEARQQSSGGEIFGPLAEGRYEARIVVESFPGELDAGNNEVSLRFAVAAAKATTEAMAIRGVIADANGNPVRNGTQVFFFNRSINLRSSRSVTRTTGTTGSLRSVYRTRLGRATEGDVIEPLVLSPAGQTLSVISPRSFDLSAEDIASGLTSVNLKVSPPKQSEDITVRILEPEDGATFFVGERIFFEGLGVDDSGNRIAGRRLVWLTDHPDFDPRVGETRRRPIGIGEFFERRLPAGTHQISLLALNREGTSNTVTRTIEVKQVEAETSAGLAVNGKAREVVGGNSIPAGYTITMRNASRTPELTATATVRARGRYSLLFGTDDGGISAQVGDEIRVEVRNTLGKRVGVRPRVFKVSPRDVAQDQRRQNLRVIGKEGAVKKTITICGGAPNLVSFPVNPSTTGDDPFMASDVARDFGASLIVRCRNGRFECFSPDPAGPLAAFDFEIMGNQAYLVEIEGDESTAAAKMKGTTHGAVSVTYEGLPWPEEQRTRDLQGGFNAIGFPDGVPENTNTEDLLDQVGGDVAIISVINPETGESEYLSVSDVLQNFDATDRTAGPFGLTDGQGILVNTRQEGQLTFRGDDED